MGILQATQTMPNIATWLWGFWVKLFIFRDAIQSNMIFVPQLSRYSAAIADLISRRIQLFFCFIAYILGVLPLHFSKLQFWKWSISYFNTNLMISLNAARTISILKIVNFQNHKIYGHCSLLFLKNNCKVSFYNI